MKLVKKRDHFIPKKRFLSVSYCTKFENKES